MTDPTPPPPALRARPWLEWPVGSRVVVRRRLEAGGYSDLLGEVLRADDDGVLVETRGGPVHVPAADIALGKRVPAPPPRRSPRRATERPTEHEAGGG